VPALTSREICSFSLAKFLASPSFWNVLVVLEYDRFSPARAGGASNETYHVCFDRVAIVPYRFPIRGIKSRHAKPAGPGSILLDKRGRSRESRFEFRKASAFKSGEQNMPVRTVAFQNRSWLLSIMVVIHEPKIGSDATDILGTKVPHLADASSVGSIR
jgi:hypothetical protein